MMSRIIVETEKSLYDDGVLTTSQRLRVPTDEALAVLSAHIGDMSDIGAILVLCHDDTLARVVSRQRPEVPVFRIVFTEENARQSVLCWGVEPLLTKEQKQPAVIVRRAIALLLKQKSIRKKQSIVVLVSETTRGGQQVHTVEVIRA